MKCHRAAFKWHLADDRKWPLDFLRLLLTAVYGVSLVWGLPGDAEDSRGCSLLDCDGLVFVF